MFDPKLPTASRQHEQVYRAFGWINTVVELSAALLFLIGSLMFFSEDWLGTG
ncbi:MAG: YrhK family protein, partial [Pseudomonadota bacterium]